MSARRELAPAQEAPALSAAPVAVARPHMPDAAALLPYLQQMDAARWYSNFGPLLLEFEARLAGRFATPTAVATVSSGTLGLTLALQAMGAEPGGYCALPSWTFVATAHAAVQAGLKLWFLDVDPQTWMLDPDATADALKRAPGPVSAIIPVAAFGRMPDLMAWKRFQSQTGVRVLLDAAAAFDTLEAAPIPAMVSLHATKVLGVGEGGFIAAEDPALISTIRKQSNFGFQGSRESQLVATNAKLSEYAAAVGLASLEGWPAARLRYRLSAQKLRIALMATPEVEFQPGWGSDWVSTVCVVRLPDGAADAVEAKLAAEGIQTRRWWGLGCHRAPAFAGAAQTDLSATERLAASTLGLPFAIDLSDEEIGRVAGALTHAIGNLGR